jgi:hypothetical protein
MNPKCLIFPAQVYRVRILASVRQTLGNSLTHFLLVKSNHRLTVALKVRLRHNLPPLLQTPPNVAKILGLYHQGMPRNAYASKEDEFSRIVF